MFAPRARSIRDKHPVQKESYTCTLVVCSHEARFAHEREEERERGGRARACSPLHRSAVSHSLVRVCALVAAKNCTLHLGNVVGMYRVFPFAAVWLADKNGQTDFASGSRFPLSSLLFSIRPFRRTGESRRGPLPASIQENSPFISS